jgi:hypothetical protein
MPCVRQMHREAEEEPIAGPIPRLLPGDEALAPRPASQSGQDRLDPVGSLPDVRRRGPSGGQAQPLASSSVAGQQRTRASGDGKHRSDNGTGDRGGRHALSPAPRQPVSQGCPLWRHRRGCATDRGPARLRRLQSNRQRTEQTERVDVVTASQHTEMKTGIRYAVRVRQVQGRHDLSRRHSLADCYLRLHRLVGRPEQPVPHDDDATPGQHRRERDLP